LAFTRIAILGLGLIGASVARAARKAGLAEVIAGFDLSVLARDYCGAQKIIDEVHVTAATAVKDAEIVILAIPPSGLEDLLREISPRLLASAILTDVISIKQAVIDIVGTTLPSSATFIPGHPIAGSDKSGPEAGREDLFEGKMVILTPPREMAKHPSTAIISRMWEAMGAQVQLMPAALHDHIYARLSHLPQLLAFAACATLEDNQVKSNGQELFRRFTRLGNSSPELWADIFFFNRDALLQAASEYVMLAQKILDELTGEEAEKKPSTESPEVFYSLFPRIAASCLILTIHAFEEKLGDSIACFAGSGFADFACLAIESPEQDMEKISAHHRQMSTLLENYLTHIRLILDAVHRNEKAALLEVLRRCKKSPLP